MNAALTLRDFGRAMNGVETNRGQELEVRKSRVDGNVSAREINILRNDVDLLAPEAADIGEHLIDQYRGTVTSGDHLRLPQMSSLDAMSMKAAIGRVLSVDTSRTAASQNDVIKEERMR